MGLFFENVLSSKNLNTKKVCIFIILIISFFVMIFMISHQKITYIENDNKISEYQENIDFSNFKTDIKVIALYLPQFHINDENNKFWGNGFTEWTNVKKSKPRFKGHHQPRIPGDKYGYLGYYDLSDIKSLEKQMSLAKAHGIYGFGIYYYWFSGKKVLEKPINIFFNSNINFKFLLIWANENWTRRWDGSDQEILLKQEYKPDDPINFIKDIKKYVTDKRYIQIDKKPVIGLYEPKKIPHLEETIRIWRDKSREFGIGEIFVLISINHYKIRDFQNLNLFDGSYEFPPRNSLLKHLLVKEKNAFIYPGLLYKSRNLNESELNFNKFPVFRGSMLEWDNCARKNMCVIFDHYSPEQFYLFNKIIINWTYKHYNNEHNFIFINAWNEWGEGSYLEPDEKYGYASLNSLSKAIFNLSYFERYITIGTNKIIVLLFLFKDDSIHEIINRINNIPYVYDLFVINEYINNIDSIKKYIFQNTSAKYFELINILNGTSNLISFLYSLSKKVKNYKYICNLNTYNYNNFNYYEEWKNYQINNLLGNTKIISEILTDFEQNKKLGMIFAEKFYKSFIKFGDSINDVDLQYLNFFLNKIYHKVNVSEKFSDFPEGNMLWAKIIAIYPIFKLLSNLFINKKVLLILKKHMEKIWIYLINQNGFLYKKILKHL